MATNMDQKATAKAERALWFRLLSDPDGSPDVRAEAAALAQASLHRPPSAEPVPCALEAIGLASLAILAGRQDLAGNDRLIPDGADWFSVVLVDAARSLRACAGGEPGAADLADRSHRRLVALQAECEAPYLAGCGDGQNLRSGAFRLMAGYHLSHAMRCLGGGDFNGAVKAARSAKRSADMAQNMRLFDACWWLELATSSKADYAVRPTRRLTDDSLNPSMLTK